MSRLPRPTRILALLVALATLSIEGVVQSTFLQQVHAADPIFVNDQLNSDIRFDGSGHTAKLPAPAPLIIPVVYRDMLYNGTTVPGPGHSDFQSFNCGVITGLVQSTLGLDSKPVFGPNGATCMTNATDFCWWYREAGCGAPGSQNTFDKVVSGTLMLTQTSTNVFQYSSTQFYPIDGSGWNAGPSPQTDNDCSGTTGHNFSFTT